MNIYLSHSKNFDYQNQFYLPVKNSPISQNHHILYPHQNSQKPFPVKNLLAKHQIQLIIAEITYPSTGQGIELGWANACRIPIIGIHRFGAKISSSLKLITRKIIPYRKIDSILPKLIIK